VITGPDNLFVLPEFEALLRDELAGEAALALRQPAGAALLLQAGAANRALPVDLRHLRATRPHVEDGGFGGKVAAASDALPYESDAFQFIVVQHAADVLAAPEALVDELARVLAPGGTLVLTGINPVSGWTPWWLWRTRGSATHARSPLQLSAHLRRSDVRVQRVQRVGQMLPLTSSQPGKSTGWLGGGYVLVARKQGPASAPTRLRPKPVTAPVRAGLAPGARRSSVS